MVLSVARRGREMASKQDSQTVLFLRLPFHSVCVANEQQQQHLNARYMQWWKWETNKIMRGHTFLHCISDSDEQHRTCCTLLLHSHSHSHSHNRNFTIPTDAAHGYYCPCYIRVREKRWLGIKMGLKTDYQTGTHTNTRELQLSPYVLAVAVYFECSNPIQSFFIVWNRIAFDAQWI